jgi:hypothetical protein
MTILRAPQRSPEWVSARLGRVTSSVAADMCSQPKKGKEETAGRRNLRVRLALERLTGKSHERSFTSQAMQDGINREPAAFAEYEAQTGELLNRCGFVMHDTLMAGGSPDGYLGNFDALVEIKSPIPATHLEYLQSGKVPGDYLKQVQHLLWLTGAKYCDWFSFNPDFPEGARTKIVRIERNEADCAAYELLLTMFLREVEAECASITSYAQVVSLKRSIA